jgi:hypothetical protein
MTEPASLTNRLTEFLRNGGLPEDLLEKYAIKAKRHGVYTNLVQFKYSQIASIMSEPLVQQARGIILDEDNGWAVVARPFDKFFNYGEPNAAEVDWSTARVQEKLDGSLMILYFYDGAWHVASSGTPDAAGDVNGSEETFADLFWRVWEEKGYLPPRDTSFTYCFELMTKHNRVVVQHPENRLVLIGMRHTEHGYEERVDYEWASCAGAPPRSGWERVKYFRLQSIADVEQTFAVMDPLKQEGYVVVDADFKRLKVKHPGYVAIHHMKDGFGPKRALDIIRTGEKTELLAHFPEWRPEFDATQARFDAFVRDLESLYAAHQAIPVQKDFAAAVKHSPSSAALFSVRAGKAASIREFMATARLDWVAERLGVA